MEHVGRSTAVKWIVILRAAIDRVLIGPYANGPRPNTPRLPFRPLWDERRLDHLYVIDPDEVTPPFPAGVIDRAIPEHDQ